MTGKRYFVTCEVGNVLCELISREISDDEFEHLTYCDIVDRLNQLTAENEQLKEELKDCHKSNHEYYVDKDKLIRLCEEFHIDWRKELEE